MVKMAVEKMTSVSIEGQPAPGLKDLEYYQVEIVGKCETRQSRCRGQHRRNSCFYATMQSTRADSISRNCVQGKPVTLGEGNVTVVEFWATW